MNYPDRNNLYSGRKESNLERIYLCQSSGHLEGAHGIHVGGNDWYALMDPLGMQKGELPV